MSPAPGGEKPSQHRNLLPSAHMRVGKIGKKRLTLNVFEYEIRFLHPHEIRVLNGFKDVKAVRTPRLKDSFFGLESVPRIQRGFSSQKIGQRFRDLTPFFPLSAVTLYDVFVAAGILDQENTVMPIPPFAGIQTRRLEAGGKAWETRVVCTWSFLSLCQFTPSKCLSGPGTPDRRVPHASGTVKKKARFFNENYP